MSNFIKMPSGCLLNTDIITFVTEEGGGIIIFVQGCDRPTPEAISMEAFMALLQPQTAPIISPVLDLDRLKVGNACSFTCEGIQRHGIIASVTGSGVIHILSSGDEYCYDPSIDEAYPYEG